MYYKNTGSAGIHVNFSKNKLKGGKPSVWSTSVFFYIMFIYCTYNKFAVLHSFEKSVYEDLLLISTPREYHTIASVQEGSDHGISRFLDGQFSDSQIPVIKIAVEIENWGR